MPATIQDRFGWSLSDKGAERLYTVFDTDSPVEARQVVEDESPSSIDIGPLRLYRSSCEVEETSNGLWHCRAIYAPRERSGAVEEATSFSFETRGGTQHITQSLQTVATYPAASASFAPPNFGGAINVDENGPQGVDINVPVFSFNIVDIRQTVDQTYIGNLYGLTATVNSAPVTFSTDDDASITLAAGEGLYLGAAGTKRSGQPWEITHAFAASPNVTGLSIGTITDIAKAGWEYLWAYYAKAEDAVAKRLIVRPIAVYVERVYRHGNWTFLDL
jgi:hypothetical protein